MFQPLYVAATGLSTFESEILEITNNLANSQTVGFKRGRVEKESLFYIPKSFKQTLDSAIDNIDDVSPEFGTGVRVSATPHDFSQGKIETTNNPLDIAIQGDGFLQFRMPDGTIAYGRAGNLHADNDGNLVDPNGHILEPGIVLPEGTTSVVIQQDGTVMAQVNNELAQTEVGQITLTKFNNPAGLKSLGQNLYASGPASGEPITGYAADTGFGTISQYSLESSNVDVISEMMRMVMVQRLFEAITKAVSSYEAIVTSIQRMKQA
ncbi:MAG: flagellar basal-body rod protein FlgG [Candidatus Saganbacteria bacterium]|nr:flagellar basal-body rod protein FlgG [Candidatus Saganbacteria bacterium]